jgi:hypothetical protein
MIQTTKINVERERKVHNEVYVEINQLLLLSRLRMDHLDKRVNVDELN